MANVLVLDSVVLILLAKTRLRETLAGLEANLLTTPQVRTEVLAKKGSETPVLERLFETQVHVEPAARELVLAGISEADASIVALAKQTGGVLVTDDKDARAAARLNGVNAMHVTFLITLALERKAIPVKTAFVILDDLLENNWFIDTATLNRYKNIIEHDHSR